MNNFIKNKNYYLQNGGETCINITNKKECSQRWDCSFNNDKCNNKCNNKRNNLVLIRNNDIHDCYNTY